MTSYDRRAATKTDIKDLRWDAIGLQNDVEKLIGSAQTFKKACAGYPDIMAKAKKAMAGMVQLSGDMADLVKAVKAADTAK
jgi:hypothetical protein